MRKQISKLCERGYWDKLQVKKDSFYEKAKQILPYMDVSGLQEKKKLWIEKIVDYIEKVDSFASDLSNKKCPFGGVSDDIIDRLDTEWKRKGYYIKHDKCAEFVSKDRKIEVSMNLCSSFGTMASTDSCYQFHNKTDIDSESEWEEDSCDDYETESEWENDGSIDESDDDEDGLSNNMAE